MAKVGGDESVRNSGLVLLAILVFAGAFHFGSVKPAWSQEDDADEVSEVDDDIALGELGSDGDDSTVPVRRGRRGGGGARAPRVTVDPSIRLGLAHRFTPEFSAEIYGRGQLGAVTRPLESRSSTAAGGLILN